MFTINKPVNQWPVKQWILINKKKKRGTIGGAEEFHGTVWSVRVSGVSRYNDGGYVSVGWSYRDDGKCRINHSRTILAIPQIKLWKLYLKLKYYINNFNLRTRSWGQRLLPVNDVISGKSSPWQLTAWLNWTTLDVCF